MATPPVTDAQAATQQATYLLAQGELGQITSAELRTQLTALMPLLQPLDAPAELPGPGIDRPPSPAPGPWSTPPTPSNY